MMNKQIAREQAETFYNAARAAGFDVLIMPAGGVVRIQRLFEKGDAVLFNTCDARYQDVLALVPLKGGSVWGTDGASVGGYAALQNGRFVMNKSGSGKRFLAALEKVLEEKEPISLK